MSFTLIVIYRPPSSNCSFYEKFETLLKESNFNKVIIMGDFNINWEDKSTRKNLKQITNNFDIKQLISGPTRITNYTKSQIDLIFTNRPERILKSCNMLTGLSDHDMILVTSKPAKKRFSSFVNKCELFGIPKNKQENFKGSIQQIEWDNLLLGIDYEEDQIAFGLVLYRVFCQCLRLLGHLVW